MANVTDAPQAQLDGEGMDRGVGFWGLFWSSEGSIIGSGWLFGALNAGAVAGPSAIIAWGIASVIILILALIHAELGGLFPVSGGTSRFPHYAFGSFAGATFGWFAYIQAASVAPIEVAAAIEYASTASWAKSWFSSSGVIHGFGIVVAVLLMVAFTAVNLIGVRWLARVNNILTTWKLIIPVLTIIVLGIFKMHSGNFSAGGGFFVHGSAIKSLFIAIPTGGIVFSLLGFEQAVQLAGEASNPARDVPRAVIFSIIIGALTYILLQVVFIGALDPKLLTEAHTWAGLKPTTSHSPLITALDAAPFYKVASLAGVAWLAFVLRLDAVISPSGTGLIYLTSGSRVLFGLSKNGYVPQAFERVQGRARVPTLAIVITTLVGLIFLLPFPSWSDLVGVVTSASVLMYAGAPLAFGALRKQKPQLDRPYRMPGGAFWAPVAFCLANFIVYWAGWGTYSTLIVVILIGYALMGVSYVFRLNPNRPKIDMNAVPWVLAYLIGMGVISFYGGFGDGASPSGVFNGISLFGINFANVLVGGSNHIHLYWDLLVLTVFSLIIYYWAINSRLSEEEVDHYVREVYPPPVAE
jgi:amino acid transporter